MILQPILSVLSSEQILEKLHWFHISTVLLSTTVLIGKVILTEIDFSNECVIIL